MLIVFNETERNSKVAINPNRIDALIYNVSDRRIEVYMSGLEKPFYIDDDFEKVVNIVNSICD